MSEPEPQISRKMEWFEHDGMAWEMAFRLAKINPWSGLRAEDLHPHFYSLLWYVFEYRRADGTTFYRESLGLKPSTYYYRAAINNSARILAEVLGKSSEKAMEREKSWASLSDIIGHRGAAENSEIYRIALIADRRFGDDRDRVDDLELAHAILIEAGLSNDEIDLISSIDSGRRTIKFVAEENGWSPDGARRIILRLRLRIASARRRMERLSTIVPASEMQELSRAVFDLGDDIEQDVRTLGKVQTELKKINRKRNGRR